MKRKLPEDAVVLRLAKSGMLASEIAEIYNVPSSSVTLCLRKFPEWKKIGQQNIQKGREKKRRWTDDRLMEVKAAYQECHSLQKTAAKLGTSISILHGLLKRAGVHIRSQSEAQTGKHNGFWKGGRLIEKSGYVLVCMKDHPYAVCGYVREHRLVMELHIGRYLEPGEVVHHKNKNKSDNRLENLQLYKSNGEHLAEELKGKVPKWTEEGKARIAEAVAKEALRKRMTGRRTRTDDL